MQDTWGGDWGGGGGGLCHDSTISTLIYQILFIKMKQEGEIRKEQFLAEGEASASWWGRHNGVTEKENPARVITEKNRNLKHEWQLAF